MMSGIMEITCLENSLPSPSPTVDTSCDEMDLPSSPPSAPPLLLYFANTVVNTATRTVTRAGVPLPLADHEYKLVELLAAQRSRSLQCKPHDHDAIDRDDVKFTPQLGSPYRPFCSTPTDGTIEDEINCEASSSS